MDFSELDTVLDLHLEGLDRELNLLNELLDGKTLDLSGRDELKKVLYQMLHIGECQIFVAAEERKCFGYCLVTKKIYPVETPKICGCINGIYVKEDVRRKGTGTELFQLAVDWLKAEKVDYLELYHMINDDRAAAFWRKMGFVNVQYNCARRI